MWFFGSTRAQSIYLTSYFVQVIRIKNRLPILTQPKERIMRSWIEGPRGTALLRIKNLQVVSSCQQELLVPFRNITPAGRSLGAKGGHENGHVTSQGCPPCFRDRDLRRLRDDRVKKKNSDDKWARKNNSFAWHKSRGNGLLALNPHGCDS
jgi:hypothetical protein